MHPQVCTSRAQADRQISPGNAHSPSRLCPSHIQPPVPYRYRTLEIYASSSQLTASYALPVRQASGLPAASFRSHLTVDTLAVRLTVPPVGSVGDLHPQVSAPCRAHIKKTGIRLIECRPDGGAVRNVAAFNTTTRRTVRDSLKHSRRFFWKRIFLWSGLHPL